MLCSTCCCAFLENYNLEWQSTPRGYIRLDPGYALLLKGVNIVSALPTLIVPTMSASAIHLSDIVPKPRWKTSWERLKYKEAHWFVEMVAEMARVFRSFSIF